MDQNASTALMMIFGIFVFVIGLSLSMYMLRTITYTAETLTYFSDSTRYYDNIEVDPYRLIPSYPVIDEGVIANKYGVDYSSYTPVSPNQLTVVVQGRLTTVTYLDGDEVEVDPIGSVAILQRCAEEYMQKNNVRFSQRLVSAETIVPVLYRYNKENFCVKLYGLISDGDTQKNVLVQLFDVNIEGKVSKAYNDTTLNTITDAEHKIEKGYFETFNNRSEYDEAHSGTNIDYSNERSNVYMFSVPWLGKPDCVKERVSLFVNGDAGYINNVYVDYRDNQFYNARKARATYRETFVSYSYEGSTFTSDEGEEFVDGGAASKDKIVIIYTEEPTS